MKRDNIFIGVASIIMFLVLFFPRKEQKEENRQPLIINSIDDIPGCIYRKGGLEFDDTVVSVEKDSLSHRAWHRVTEDAIF